MDGRLEPAPNPFALVVMAHLKTKATRGKKMIRLRWKIRLIRQLYERDYERQQVLELLRFIDWVLKLPEELADRFNAEVRDLEEELKVRYVTTFERLTRIEMLERLLKCRYKELPAWVRSRLEKASVAELDRWTEQFVNAKRLEDVFATG